MSMPHDTAPDSFALDYHTQQFFDAADHVGHVSACLQLDLPELVGMVFIGRAARFLDGNVHLVIRDVNAHPGETGEVACLVSAMPLSIDAVDEAARAKAVDAYFRHHLHHVAGDGRDDDSVPTLGGSLVQVGFSRLHFEAAMMLGLEYHPEGGCNLIDMRDYPNMAAERPFVYMGDALYDYEPPEYPQRAFVEMNDSLFHARIEGLVSNFEGALAISMRFYRMNEEERAREVFGCSLDALESAVEVLRLGLLIEMGAGGAFASWASAKWHPWGVDEEAGIEGRGAGGAYLGSEVTPSLERMMAIVSERWSCRMSDEIRLDDEGTFAFAQRWVGTFQIWVERPSAHEVMEASVRLRELLGES